MQSRESAVKVLYVSHSSGGAGGEQYLYYQVTQIDRDQFSPAVVVPHGEGWLTHQLKTANIPIFTRAIEPWINFCDPSGTSGFKVTQKFLKGLRARIWGLVGIIERERIDLIYTNTVTPLEGALAARATRRPHIWHLHEAFLGNEDLNLPLLPGWAIEQILLGLSAKIISVSQDILNSSYPRLVGHRKVTVIHNGVDIERFRPDPNARERLAAGLGLDPNRPIVGTAGGLIVRKDHATLLKAVALMKEKPSVLIIGEGPLRQELEILARNLLIDKVTYFLGQREDVDNLIPGLDIFILPSKNEGLPLAVLEASSCGIPVIATRCNGVPELIVEGETGRIVSIGDAVSMASAIDDLMRNPERRKIWGGAARRRTEQFFSLPRHLERIETVLMETLEGKRKTPAFIR